MRLGRPASVALDALLSTACCAVGYAALRLGGSPVGFWVGMALAAALIYVARRSFSPRRPSRRTPRPRTRLFPVRILLETSRRAVA